MNLPWQRHALLTAQEMAAADRAAVSAGVAGERLMARAGAAVARVIRQRWPVQPVLVLCGPGNNGGDGFVVARLLAESGWPVRLMLLGDVARLQGDAAEAAARWTGDILPWEPTAVGDVGLVVDAILGAGLMRELGEPVLAMLDAVRRSGAAVCAVDVPSGIDGSTGAVRGDALQADCTVTFFRRKPGHLLYPGRGLCGQVELADIGIPESIWPALSPVITAANHPDLWLDGLPGAKASGHKYDRGHLLVLGGESMTGAARLAARAAQRMGAGLVTVAAPPAVWPVYASALESIMVATCGHDGADDWPDLLADTRRNALLLGPGLGIGSLQRARVLAALATQRACVLDADALSAFAHEPQTLLSRLHDRVVLTPHEGEFARLFGQEPSNKLERARRAAALGGAVVVLKGADTVIAAPDGRAIINHNAPPALATGGTGDVLAGMIAGLLARGAEPFVAASAAVWMHGRAAGRIGSGLIADDLLAVLQEVQAELAGDHAPHPVPNTPFPPLVARA